MHWQWLSLGRRMKGTHFLPVPCTQRCCHGHRLSRVGRGCAVGRPAAGVALPEPCGPCPLPWGRPDPIPPRCSGHLGTFPAPSSRRWKQWQLSLHHVGCCWMTLSNHSDALWPLGHFPGCPKVNFPTATGDPVSGWGHRAHDSHLKLRRSGQGPGDLERTWPGVGRPISQAHDFLNVFLL